MPASFAQGASGRIVKKIQGLLAGLQVPKPGGGTEPALDPANVNGEFRRNTRLAVQRAQTFFLLPATGEVDEVLWARLTQDPWPSPYERALALVAAFEGHNYTKAAGNWDGAGVTWGVIGFTLVTNVHAANGPSYGSLRTLLMQIDAEQPTLLNEVFGVLPATVLRNAMQESPAALKDFGRRISDPAQRNHTLLLSWQEGFRRLGEEPAVQRLQDELARTMYYAPALQAASTFAADYGMDAEQTNQLFFDIQVNNGGLNRAERQAAIDALNGIQPNAPLALKLNAITEVLARSRPRFATDIRARKGTISNGFGTVHGKRYRLNGWGFPPPPTPSPAPAPPQPTILRPRLTILGFDPVQQGEQLALASAVTPLVQPELAVSLAADGLWPNGNGTVLLRDEQGTSTLSFRGLLDSETAHLVQEDGDDLLQAVNLVFRDPVGILAVFGQATPLPAALQQQAIIGRGSRGYAGMMLHESRELRLVLLAPTEN